MKETIGESSGGAAPTSLHRLHESQWPPVLFDRDLAAILGIHVATLRKYRNDPDSPFSELPRIGRKPRWSRDQVLQALSARAPRGRR